MDASRYDDLFSDDALAPPSPAAAPTQIEGNVQTDEQADALFSDEALAPPQSSMLGAAARSAERGVVPALIGIPAAAAAGAALGAIAGPPGSLAGAIGGIVGGLGGMFVGAASGEALQDWALSKLSEDDKKRFGFDEQQRLVDEQQHPYASQLGGLVPYLVTARPYSPEAAKNAGSLLEKFLYDPKGQRALGGGLMGAWELGQEAYNGEVDPWKVMNATAFGVIFNHQNRVGAYLHNIGARPVQRMTGRLPVEPGAEPEQEPSRSMGGAMYSPRTMPDLYNPTLRELDAAGVMGPGNTEYTWMGTKRRPALEELFAHKRLEEEYDALYGPQPPTPDQITATARKMEPEIFAARDALEEQRRSIEASIELYRSPSIEQYDEVRGQIATLEDQLAGTKNKAEQRRIKTQIRLLTGERDAMWSRRQGELAGKVDENLTKLHGDLAAVNAQIRGQGRDIARAHRMASEALGAGDMAMEHRFDEVPAYWREIAPGLYPSPEGAAVSAAGPKFDVAAEQAKIVEAAKAEHIAAGAHPDHAEEEARLDAHKYTTRTIRMGGVYESPYALWVAEHAVVGPWERGSGPSDLFSHKPPPPPPAGPPAPGAGSSAIRAAEGRLAEAGSVIPERAPVSEQPAAPVPGRLPKPASVIGSINEKLQTVRDQLASVAARAPGGEATGVEGAVSVMPEAAETTSSEPISATEPAAQEPVAQPSPEAPPAPTPAGLAVGDVIPLKFGKKSTRYEITSLTDTQVGLTPVGEDASATPLKFPRAILEEKVASQLAESGAAKAEGEKITLNGEALDPKLEALLREKLAAQEAESATLRQEVPPPLPSDDPNFLKETRQTLVKEPQSLLGFVRANGGIKDWKGELKSQDMHQRYPGVVNKDGKSLDKMREIAEEAGYLPEGSVPDDLTQALLSKEPVYSRRDFDQAEAFKAQERWKAIERELKDTKERIRGYYPELEQEVIDEAAMGMVHDGLSEDAAIDAAITKFAKEYPEWTPDEQLAEIVDSWAEGAGRQAAGENRGGAPERPEGASAIEGLENYSVEAGAEGKPQSVIPGAEKITDRQLAERRADQPMRGGNEAPGGMFDEGNTNQRDLFQEIGNNEAERRALGAYNRDLRKIWLKPDHNASTIIHEHGHEYLDHLIKDASHEAAPQQLKDDLETVKRWLGWKGNQKRFTGDQQEKFARGFERYLFDGIAPSKELAVVFQRFANWLRNVYGTVSGLTKPDEIPADVRAVFDRLLAVDPHFVTVAGEGAGKRSMADIHTSEARAVTPERAGPMADRAMAEATRATAELPREIRNELGAAAERAGVGESASGLGGSAERAGGMAEDSGRSAAFDASGASRAGNGAESERGRANADAGGGDGREGAAGSTDTTGGDASFGRDDGRFVDKAGNIRLENLTTWESIKEALREIAYGHNGFIAERRGRIADDMIMATAEEMGFEGAEDIVAKWMRGQALNAEQIMALRLLVRDSAADLHAKAKAVADGGDWKAVRDYAIAKERHIMIQRTVSGVTAEAGRALRAFRDISGSAKAKTIEKLMRQATGQTLYQLRDEASLLAGLDSEVAINRNVRHMGSNLSEGTLEYATNNLISGLITHATYTLSNHELALWKALAETPFRAVISNAMKAMGKEMGPGEVTRFGEVWQQILGLGQGFAPGLKGAAQSMKAGLTTRLPRETMKNLPGIRPGQEVVEAPMVDMAYSMKEVVPDIFGAMRGSLDALAAYGKMLAMGKEGEPFFRWANNPLYKIPDAKIRGVTVPVGGFLSSPSRLVSSLHAFNRIQFYFMELNAEAFRAASAELESGKIGPEDFTRRLAELKASPDGLMIDRATKAATETTQMAPGGQFTQRLSRWVNSPIGGPNGPPLLRFIDPFIHISSNVLSGAFLKRTPLGFLSGPIREDLLGKNGRQAQTTAMARMAAGTSVLAFMGIMKAQGYITGAAPDDKTEAATWALAGYQPYSIKINGTWYPYHRLGVLGLLMGIGADLYDVGEHLSKSAASYAKDDLKKMDEEMMQAMGALLHSISNNVFEESFMRGPSELMKAVEGGENAMSRYVRNFVSTMFTPFSVGMSQVARMADPVSRQARSLADAIKNKIPGMSQDLFPRRNLWGDPIMSQTSVATKSAAADPVNMELYRLGVAKAPVERKIRGVELTDEQYDDYQRIAGRLARMQAELMVNSPGWQRVPDPIKKIQIEKMIDSQREAAIGLMMMKHRTIPQEAAAAKRRRFLEIETRAVQ